MTHDTALAALAAPIAAIRGGAGTGASEALTAFAERRRAEGVAVAGVVVAGRGPRASGHAGHAGGDCACGGALRDLVTDEIVPIKQDLGPGSEACNLDTSGLAAACERVERAIARGADVVVLDRFGGQEAAHGGLVAAFQAAIAAEIPVICVVTPHAEAEWDAFAGDLASWLPVEERALDAWWSGHRTIRRGTPEASSAAPSRSAIIRP